MNKNLLLKSIVLLALSSPSTIFANNASTNADANNPLANMTAFNIQDYYVSKLSGFDKPANQAWFRFVKPLKIKNSTWIIRASLPVMTSPTDPRSARKTGLGDFNIFAAYMIDIGNPKISFGFGPQVTAPTATDRNLGSGKLSAGFANVLFNANSDTIQYGYLLTWQASIAGQESRSHVNAAAFQPFAFYQLGNGLYVRTTPIWTYDITNSNYNIPLGIGIGKVIQKNKVVYNLAAEPQVSISHRGKNQPLFQVFLALNMQFTS